MSDIVIKTLRRELKKKQDRIHRLEILMSKRHIRKETAKAMDAFARRFNSAATSEEKIKIADEWKETNDLFVKQCAKAKTQNDSYMKWLDEQTKLQSEAYDLSNEIGLHELRESLRRPKKGTQTTVHEES